MKINIHYKPKNDCIDCWIPRDGILDMDISTSDIIAELEKRRPNCKKCQRPPIKFCTQCIWQYNGYGIGKDNFKGE